MKVRCEFDESSMGSIRGGWEIVDLFFPFA